MSIAPLTPPRSPSAPVNVDPGQLQASGIVPQCFDSFHRVDYSMANMRSALNTMAAKAGQRLSASERLHQLKAARPITEQRLALLNTQLDSAVHRGDAAAVASTRKAIGETRALLQQQTNEIRNLNVRLHTLGNELAALQGKINTLYNGTLPHFAHLFQNQELCAVHGVDMALVRQWRAEADEIKSGAAVLRGHVP